MKIRFDLKGKDGEFTMNHWFDGYAILYKFDITDTKVTFHKRYLQSGVYQRALEAGKPVVVSLKNKVK